MLTTVNLSDREIDILIHHWKVEEARWDTNENPEQLGEAKALVFYWDRIKGSRP